MTFIMIKKVLDLNKLTFKKIYIVVIKLIKMKLEN